MKDLEAASPFYTDRQAILLKLYRSTFPMVAKFIANRGGTLEQAKDIFHDALILLWEKQEKQQVFVASDKAYLFGICRHLWLKQIRHDGFERPFEPDFDIEDKVEESPSVNALLNLLESTGRRCLNLLTAFYYDKLSISELSEYFGFKTIRSATVQKYKCLEKVRETVKEKALQYEDFIE